MTLFEKTVRDEDIDKLLKKSQFTLLSSKLIDNIYNDDFYSARSKIAEMNKLLIDIEEIK